MCNDRSSPAEDLAFAAEFPAATREQWLRLVDGVLKGAPFDKRLVARTYDGLRSSRSIRATAPRSRSRRARRRRLEGHAARRPSRSWRRQRAGAARSRERRDRADAGVRGLGQRERLRPRRSRRDARPRARRRLSRCRRRARLQRQRRRRATPRRTSPRWCGAAGSSRTRVEMRFGARSARRAWRRPARVRRRGASSRPLFAGLVAELAGARLSRAVRGRRRARDPQCRRLGGAGACLRARAAPSPICARSKQAASRSMRRAA